MLVSRAKKQAGALSSTLNELGCQVIEIPFIEIRKPSSFAALDTVLHNLANYDWLILTSVNGVEALFERMAKYKLDNSALVAPEDRGDWSGDEERHREARIAGGGDAEGVRCRIGRRFVAPAREREARAAGAGQGRARRDSARTAQSRSDSRCDRSVRNGGSRSIEASACELRSAGKRKPHAITFTSSSTVKNFVALVGTARCARGAQKALAFTAHRLVL